MQEAQQHLMLQQRKKRKIWISSDFHFSHSNIIKFCPESRGQFQSVDEMGETLVNNLNSDISVDDTLIIVGDIGFGKPAVTCDYLNRINGKKIIVWGNHDTRLRYSTEFASVKNIIGAYDYLEFTHIIDDKKHHICVMHFPLMEWHRKHHGAINLFGHKHTPASKNIPTNRSMDIGIDGGMMRPHLVDNLCITLSEIPFKDIRYAAVD